ncbi:uncharacterized protein LOC120016922 isoform X2 [Tripterygium wilfordii]|uniref:uncharacterized protein LOC120016922 isoform X2 n=1 Tax=Tripterygium wilfordii TaxID=458696 RepID=UPI0018F861D6|nr:uncharacterized protein LOC120016922 isoform X2 [Tripterygium wilfordii]
MEVDLVTSGLLEEETFGLDDNNDHKDFEGGRYGLCMDIIIDRGVLDCCQNWCMIPLEAAKMMRRHFPEMMIGALIGGETPCRFHLIT